MRGTRPASPIEAQKTKRLCFLLLIAAVKTKFEPTDVFIDLQAEFRVLVGFSDSIPAQSNRLPEFTAMSYLIFDFSVNGSIMHSNS